MYSHGRSTTAKVQGAEAFLSGDVFAKSNIITDGQTIWSYGKHFPMAYRELGIGIWVNESRYSMTTSHHQSALRGVMAQAGFCPSDEIRTIDGHTMRLWR